MDLNSQDPLPFRVPTAPTGAPILVVPVVQLHHQY